MTRVIHYRAEWSAEIDALIEQARSSGDDLSRQLAEHLHVARLAIWDYERNDASRMAAINVLAVDAGSAESHEEATARLTATADLLSVIEAMRELQHQGINPIPALPELYSVYDRLSHINMTTKDRRDRLVSAARDTAVHDREAQLQRDRIGATA